MEKNKLMADARVPIMNLESKGLIQKHLIVTGM